MKVILHISLFHLQTKKTIVVSIYKLTFLSIFTVGDLIGHLVILNDLRIEVELLQMLTDVMLVALNNKQPIRVVIPDRKELSQIWKDLKGVWFGTQMDVSLKHQLS